MKVKILLKKYLYIILPLCLILSGCGISTLTNLLPSTDSNFELDTPAPINNIKAQRDEDNALKDKEADENLIQLSSNTASLDIDSEGRNSPFVPYRERNLKYDSMNFGDLPAPPISGEMDEDLNQLITAKVTGIVYDDKSPSALVNVLDNDYLVRPGDKIESFEIAAITKDYVSIKTGSNIYRAKVGDIVDGEMYGTGVYNLGHRFAGRRTPARSEDILIVKTKKESEDKKSDDTGFNDMSLPPIPEMNNILPKIKINKDADLPVPNLAKSDKN